MLFEKILPLLLLAGAAPGQGASSELLHRLDEGAGALIELGHAELAVQVQEVAREARAARAEQAAREEALQDLEDEFVRAAIALRGHGLGWRAEQLEAQRARPGRHTARDHRALAGATAVLAGLEPEQDWGQLARSHAERSKAASREERRAREARELELLRLALQALPADSPAERERFSRAVQWREARAAGGVADEDQDTQVVIWLFESAARALVSQGRSDEAEVFDRAAKARVLRVRRGEEREASRRAGLARNAEAMKQRWTALEESADSEEALRQATLQGLAFAGQAFEQAGEQGRAVTAQGARRALNRRAFDSPGAPSREEVSQHLREAAAHDRRPQRARWLRELAELVQPSATTTPVAPRGADRRPAQLKLLLGRLEALERELSALRAALDKR